MTSTTDSIPKSYIGHGLLIKTTTLVGFCLLGVLYFVVTSKKSDFHDKRHFEINVSNIHSTNTKSNNINRVNHGRLNPLIKDNGKQSRLPNGNEKMITHNAPHIHDTKYESHTTKSYVTTKRYTINKGVNNNLSVPLTRKYSKHLAVKMITHDAPYIHDTKYESHTTKSYVTTKRYTTKGVNNDLSAPLTREHSKHLAFQTDNENLMERKSLRKQPAIREYMNPVLAVIQQNNWQGAFLTEILQNSTIKNVIAQAPMQVKLPETSKQIEFPQSLKISTNTNCAKLFDADSYHVMEAENAILNGRSPTPFISDRDLLYSVQNCDRFVTNNGYIMDDISKSELDFPIAYSIMTYKDISQVEHLLRAIYRPQNFYCIHVDQKSKRTFKAAARDLAACFDNVFLSSRSVPVYWGHYSVLDAELVCLEDLWRKRQNATKKWKYFINLTGQEFPLKTNWEIVQILKANEGAVWVGATLSSIWATRWSSTFSYNLNTDPSHPVKHPVGAKGTPPYSYRFAKGPLHVALPYYFVDFVVNDKIAIELRNWLNDTYVPDETFFSTLVYSGHLGVPGAYTGTYNYGNYDFDPLVRFKMWTAKRHCKGRVQRMLCIMSIWNLPELKTRPELFVNKFEANYHPVAYMCLEELHWNKTRVETFLFSRKMEPHFDTSPYQYLPWIRHYWRKKPGTTPRPTTFGPNIKHTKIKSDMIAQHLKSSQDLGRNGKDFNFRNIKHAPRRDQSKFMEV